MARVLVDLDDSSSSEAAAGDRDSVPSGGGGGGGRHYRPAAAVTGACALHWVPFAAAVATARALLGASHEDLRLRPHLLSRALSGAFFFVVAPQAGPCAARFPEGGLYVCADLQRALMQVSVKEASHGACDCFYDTVGYVMRLLVGDGPDGRGPAVFDRDKFEATFGLEWLE